jgi:DNA-binding phage protein
MPTSKVRRRVAQIERKGPLVLRSVQEYLELVMFEASRTSEDPRAIAEKAGVAAETYRAHASGQVRDPRYRTCMGILKALGYDVLVGKARKA